MTESNQPPSADMRRNARSDSALPSVTVVIILVMVVIVALVFIGYRVFQLESQRQGVNESLRLLEGKDKLVREARGKKLELSRLRVDHANLTSEVTKLIAEMGRLEQEIARQQSRIEAGSENLKLIEKEVDTQRARRRKVLEEKEQLLQQVEQGKRVKDRADLASARALSRRDELAPRVKELEAQSLDLETVAEGVETDEQAYFWREAGCDEIQGYLTSAAVSATEFERFLTLQKPD